MSTGVKEGVQHCKSTKILNRGRILSTRPHMLYCSADWSPRKVARTKGRPYPRSQDTCRKHVACALALLLTACAGDALVARPGLKISRGSDFDRESESKVLKTSSKEHCLQFCAARLCSLGGRISAAAGEQKPTLRLDTLPAARFD